MKKVILVIAFVVGFALVWLCGCGGQPTMGPAPVVRPDPVVPIVTTIKTEVEYVGLREISRNERSIVYEWSAVIAPWKPADGGLRQPTKVSAIGTLVSSQGNKLGDSQVSVAVVSGKKPYVAGKITLKPDQAALVKSVLVTAGYQE